MRGALVGQAKDDRDTSTDSSTRAGESAPAPLLGAAPRVEGPVELSNDPEPGLVTCERCGCECYDWVREWGGRVECLTCVLHDRDVARDAARIAGDALRARDAELDAERQDEESDIVVAGRQVPFVQVGMIVHPDDCLNCERDGNPLWCSALVCDIRDDDETARFGMMATLLFRNGERREEPCGELRRRWRLARDFDQARVYTGRWGAIPRGSVWPVAEVCEEA